MAKQFLMGNEAIALGAVRAGVNLVSGYPGTPSTEILETVAKINPGNIYVEWSVNEKAALEVAAGASYAGARTMVTMKQVGLNVASDPLMSLAYIGVKGGMVVVAADDPGPISSQTEQDTRHFAHFCKVPVFDPSSPEEAFEMIRDAFDFSEKYGTPVLFRPTTRVCHSCAAVEVGEEIRVHRPEGFIKDAQRWVVFPRTSYLNHLRLEERNPKIGEDFSAYRFNLLQTGGKKGIAVGGVSFAYAMEALGGDTRGAALLKIATPYPFPEKLALQFLRNAEEVLVLEELDPVIERELIYLCGKHALGVKIHGKLDGSTQAAGENSVESAKRALSGFLGVEPPEEPKKTAVELPVRPPVLCAGCPHRASFIAVKTALKGRKAVFCGDIGCYTLGNAMPLDMVDTCLCMGAGVTIAQGLQRIEPDAVHVAFIGDSTFFAAGITGVVNAVYNRGDILLAVLDNSTTAMTGHQEHPGTGRTAMRTPGGRLSIEKILEAIGADPVDVVDPLRLSEAVRAVKKAAELPGVKAVVFRSPCIAVTKATAVYAVGGKCVGCGKCVRELGCPAVSLEDGRARIESALCAGCSVCAQVCPAGAITKAERSR